MLIRRSFVELIYKGIDISTNLQNDLLSFSYTDNASGTADDVSIEIHDAKRKWISNWMFEKGDTFVTNILTMNWRKEGEKIRLPCGYFLVDQPEYKGRPSVISLKGISTPANSNFMHTKRNKVWKNISLKAIGNDIATRYGLKLFFDSKTNPTFKSKAQTDTSDAAFLQETCENEGFGFKVTDMKIIIFNESFYESRKSVAKFKENSSSVLSYTFKSSLANTAYAGVSLKYHDAKSKKTIEYMFSLNEIDKGKDKIYKINKRVSDLEEAKRLAQSTLRKLNKKETTATLELIGDTRLLASSTIELEGFGSFDGKYYIDKATHSIGNGFTTSIDVHKVLKGGY
ncbi:MAG: phage late control D family protein [Paenisporosarcina sp.]